MYYPKSQIITNLYSNGEYQIIGSDGPYIGYYWKSSQERFFTGKTPQDFPTQELIRYHPAEVLNADSDDISLSNTSQIAYPTSYQADGILIGLDGSGDYNFPLLSGYVLSNNIEVGKTILIPSFSSNLPTQNDYTIGEFRRYFCKKTNEILYIEINKDTFDKLVKKDPTILFQYYTPFSIPWKLTGNEEQVYKTNKNLVQLTINKLRLPRFEDYLKKDYTKYYKKTV